MTSVSGGAVTKINEQIGVLMEEKNGYAAGFDHLMSERQNVIGCTKGLLFNVMR